VRFDIRPVDGTFALTMVLLLEFSMSIQDKSQLALRCDNGENFVAVARVNGVAICNHGSAAGDSGL
jgi:hypothetical protein